VSSPLRASHPASLVLPQALAGFGPERTDTLGAFFHLDEKADMPRTNTTKHISEAQLRECAAQGLTWVEVSKRAGIALQRIRSCASVLGIRSAYYGPLGAKGSRAHGRDLDAWVGRLASGHALQEIADDEGITRQAVFQALKRAGKPTCVRAAVRAKHAAVAQQAEQPPCMRPVRGSIPRGGTNPFIGRAA
jgi:hypothetical protein